MFNLDMQEGSIYPMGFHYGFIVNQINEPIEKYWCLRLPIPFTEHHMQDYMRDCLSMHQCNLLIFRAKTHGNFRKNVGDLARKTIRFIWVNVPEYNYCATSGQYLREMEEV